MKPPKPKNAKKPVSFIVTLRRIQRSSRTLIFLASPAA